MAHLPSAARLNLAMLGCQPMGGSRRPGLTRQTMIETALLLLDEVGLDGLTVRRLAAELGVQSPSLYWHIRTKQELLDGMADTIVQAAGMGPPRRGARGCHRAGCRCRGRPCWWRR